MDYALIETAIGRCGLAWSERGLTRLQLPEASDDATRARVTGGIGGARVVALAEAPPFVRALVADLDALLDGRSVDFATIPLDLQGVPDFSTGRP